MVTIIKKGAVLKNIRKALNSIERKKKYLDANKYCGTVKISEDAMLIQRKLRGEWR
jgi:hypothetical protein